MKRLNVLVFFTSLTYCGECSSSPFRGAERRFIEIVKRWKNADLTIITTKNDAHLLDKEGVKANFITFNYEDKSNTLFNTVSRIILSIKKGIPICRKNHFNIIYVYTPLFPNLIPAYVLSKVSRLQTIIVYHVFPFKNLNLKNMLNTYHKKLDFSIKDSLLISSYDIVRIFFSNIKNAKIISINSQIKSTLINSGFHKDNIKINGNGIDINKLFLLDSTDKEFDICYCGALLKYKGIFDLIDSMYNIQKRHNINLKTVVMGYGNKQMENDLSEYIKNLGLEDNIHFTGFVDKEKVYNIMSKSKLFVFPSRYESWAIVISEAMALGVPVITYDIGIYDDIYEDGIIQTEIGDIAMLSDKIITLLKDHELYRRTKDNARRIITNHSWDCVSYEELKILSDFSGKNTT